MKKPTASFSLVLSLLAALTTAPPITAQNIAPRTASDFLDPQNGVTEAELVTRALAANPELAAQRHQVVMSAGEVTQARLRKNPPLTLGGMKEINGDDNRFSIGGSLPLELFGRRARRTEVAERKRDATQDAVDDRERLLTGEVRMRFGDALAALRNLEFIELLLSANRDFLKLMEDRVHQGAVPSLDADETRVEVSRMETLRIDYQAKAEIAVLALKESVGMQPEETMRLKGSLELAPRGYDPKELLQLAVAHRPDLAFQKANEAVATGDLRQQKAEAKPDVSVFGSYERPNSGFSLDGVDAGGNLRAIRQTFNYAVFGLDISLPLFNRNQGAIAADTAAVQAARSQIAAVDLSLRYEVTENLVRFEGAQTRVAVYRGGVRDQAARNLEVVRKTYGYGRIPLLDVIAEQRRYIDLETGFTNVLFDAYAARVALEQAVGASLP